MAESYQRVLMRKTSDIWSTALRGIPAFPGNVRVTEAIARIAAIAGSGWGSCSLGNGAMIRMNLNGRIERQMRAAVISRTCSTAFVVS
jgi:hypothetical protein